MPFRLGRFDRLTMKRVFVIFGLIFILFFSFAATTSSFARPVYAADPTYAAVSPAYAFTWPGQGVFNDIKAKLTGIWQIYQECGTNVGCWTNNVVASLLSGTIFHLAGGGDPVTMINANSWAEAFPDGFGLVGAVGTLADGVYENPLDIHLASFFRRELSENLLTSPAYATIGTTALRPIETAWTQVRKIAYALFVVVVGAIALMIILQKQIAPRVVVTVTHALPKIFFSLILITLSFPIAALFVDLFIVWLPKVITGPSGIDLSSVMPPAAPSELTQHLPGLFGSFGANLVLGIISMALTEGLASIPALIVIALMLIAAVIILFFVVFQLIYRYVRILILTVLSPLLLLFGSLPGQEAVVTNWFKDLAVQTLYFPAVVLVVWLSLSVLASGIADALGMFGAIPGVRSIVTGTISGFLHASIALLILLMSFKIPGILEKAIQGRR